MCVGILVVLDEVRLFYSVMNLGKVRNKMILNGNRGYLFSFDYVIGFVFVIVLLF